MITRSREMLRILYRPQNVWSATLFMYFRPSAAGHSKYDCMEVPRPNVLR